jgi:2,4-dienoyl-CoA reductase (NADPH2)
LIVLKPAVRKKRIAVVGAGPAGLACATTAAEAGHRVALFDAASEIGGQFNLARRIPGKDEFAQTLRYYLRTSSAPVWSCISIVASVKATSQAMTTSCSPPASFPHSGYSSIDHPKVAGYTDIVILGRKWPANVWRSSAPGASASTSASS